MADSNEMKLVQRTEWLREVSLLADIAGNLPALSGLAAITEERSFRAGQNIIEEAKVGTEMFLLISGKASVHKNTPDGDSYKVAVINSSQHAFFGEGGLLDGEARSATIKAETDCVCLVLAKPAFEVFGAKHPQWALPVMTRITQQVMGRLRKANSDLMLLYNALVSEVRGGN